MQHREKKEVYCIETIRSDGGRQCVGARKGMSEKGGECFPLTYGRGHKRRNDVRGRERAMSIRAGRLYIRQTKERSEEIRMSGKSQTHKG